MKAMAKNPDDRYGSAEELRADLLRFADGRPVEAVDPGMTSMMTALGTTTMMGPTTGRTMAVLDGTTVHPGQDDEERKKRNRRLIIILVVLLVALGIIAFFLLRSVLVSKVDVPDVTGVPQSVATQTLKNDGLAVGTTSFQTNEQDQGHRAVAGPVRRHFGRQELHGRSGGEQRSQHPHRHRALGDRTAADRGHPAHHGPGSELHGQGHHQYQSRSGR